MSLLENGPDVIYIRPDVVVVDDHGTPVKRPGPVEHRIRCRVQEFATADYGTTPGTAGSLDPITGVRRIPGGVGTSYIVTGVRWLPGSSWSEITWEGRKWDVIGEPMRTNGSPRTRHWRMTIRGREFRPTEQNVPEAGAAGGGVDPVDPVDSAVAAGLPVVGTFDTDTRIVN